MDLSKVRLLAALLIIIVVAIPGRLSAQGRSLMDLYAVDGEDTGGLASDRQGDNLRASAQDVLASTPFAPLEGPVDPETYRVGPNDQFAVSIGGLEPRVTPVRIAADGGLVIPGLGRIETRDKTLAEVSEEAHELLGSSFRNVETGFALVRPREFWVHVSGAVPNPGRYLARPVGRVEDVLKEAFFLGAAQAKLDGNFKPALRNIDIHHRDGTRSSVDLVRYYRTGDTSANPYLQDGDAVVVPSYDPVRSSVFVSGDIPFPGNYDFKSGDSILDIIRLGAGNLDLGDHQPIRLIRRDDEGNLQSLDFTVSTLLNDTTDAPSVRPLDHIHVVDAAESAGIAAADGRLRYPGQYPIEIGVTTLVDLIDMAGGFRDDALIRGSYLERGSAFDRETGFERAITSPSGGYEIITDSSSVLWQMRLGDFDFFSRQFLARWLKMHRRVSIDVAAAIQPDAKPVFLQDGDRLFVPRDERSVYVIGEVARPGRTQLQAGLGAEDYIAAVGGRGPMASDTYVIRAGTGQIMPANSPVGSGDYLFVDRQGGEISSIESERLSIESERLILMDRDLKIRGRQIWLQALTAAAAVVTTTILVIRELEN